MPRTAETDAHRVTTSYELEEYTIIIICSFAALLKEEYQEYSDVYRNQR